MAQALRQLKKVQKKNNMNKINSFILLLALLFSSCNQEKKAITKALTGHFVIESMLSNNKELIYDLTGNDFSFNENNALELPKFTDDLKRRDTLKKRSIYDFTTTDGSWDFYKKEDNYYLKITTSNSHFNGIYRFYFIDYKVNKHLILVIENDSMQILAVKDYFFYDQNKSLVNKVIKCTKNNAKKALPEKFKYITQ